MAKKIIYAGKTYIAESKLNPKIEYSEYEYEFEDILSNYGFEIKIDDSRLDPRMKQEFSLDEGDVMFIIEGSKLINGIPVEANITVVDDNTGKPTHDTTFVINDTIRIPFVEYSSINDFSRKLSEKLTKLNKANVAEYLASLVR